MVEGVGRLDMVGGTGRGGWGGYLYTKPPHLAVFIKKICGVCVWGFLFLMRSKLFCHCYSENKVCQENSMTSAFKGNISKLEIVMGS